MPAGATFVVRQGIVVACFSSALQVGRQAGICNGSLTAL